MEYLKSGSQKSKNTQKVFVIYYDEQVKDLSVFWNKQCSTVKHMSERSN